MPQSMPASKLEVRPSEGFPAMLEQPLVRCKDGLSTTDSARSTSSSHGGLFVLAPKV